MKLYTYFRSSAAYRVRIALNLKNIPHELVGVNLLNRSNKVKVTPVRIRKACYQRWKQIKEY